ncbi:hypothetical protein D3C80_2054980 [compost metagenome]
MGAIDGRLGPWRMGTWPSLSKVGTTDSICENAASYSATSTTWPSPVRSRWRSAARMPKAV